ncbi:MAG: DMT family transporter [Anaerolineales bacterium]
MPEYKQAPLKNAASPRGYFICVSATFAWAFTSIIIRYLTTNFQLPPLVLAFWRDFFVSTTLILVFLLFNRQRLFVGKENIPFFMAYGLILLLFNALWTFSVALNGAAVSTVLAYSSSAFTALIAWRFLNESLGWGKLFAVLLALLGCVFISGAHDKAAWAVNPFGIITGLSSGIAFAGYSLMGKISSNRGFNSWSALLYSFFFAALFFLPLNAIADGFQGRAFLPTLFWLGNKGLGWLALILLAMGPTIGGYGLYTLSLDSLPASVANLIAMLEPVITSILAYFLLSERLTAIQLVGSGMIIVSVILIRIVEVRQGTPEVVAPV